MNSFPTSRPICPLFVRCFARDKGPFAAQAAELDKDRQRQYSLRQRVLSQWMEAKPRNQPDAFEKYLRREAMCTALKELIVSFSQEEKCLYLAYFIEQQMTKDIARQNYMTENEAKIALKRLRRKAQKRWIKREKFSETVQNIFSYNRAFEAIVFLKGKVI